MVNAELKNLPYITTEQMREVDRVMIEEFHIELIQMMENAGRNLAQLAIDLYLGQDDMAKTVHILAGRGGNGGGGLVCARHLHNRGYTVQVILSRPVDSFKGITRHQLDILEQMRIPIIEDSSVEPTAPDLIVDALIGYSLAGNPRGRTLELIEWANKKSCPILSLDVPSGLDATTGIASEPCIVADATMTLALPKRGFQTRASKPFTGEIFLADISVPKELYQQMSIKVGNLFSSQSVIKL